jgi:hypothetical protein
MGKFPTVTECDIPEGGLDVKRQLHDSLVARSNFYAFFPVGAPESVC